MNLMGNRFFIIAIVLSVIIHLYLFRINFSPFTNGSEEIEIAVTFIPDAKRAVPEKPLRRYKQITIPEEKPGEGGYYKTYDKNRILNSYLDMIKKEIDKRKFSPPESMYFGLIGNAAIGFTITGNGSFRGITVLRSSGDPLLDKTALNAVADSSGAVKRPLLSGRGELKVCVTVKYQYGL